MSQRLTVRLDDDLEAWVAEQAEQRDRSLAYIVNDCVKQVARDDTIDRKTDATHTDAAHVTVEQFDALRSDVEKLKSLVSDMTADGSPVAVSAPVPDDSDDDTPTLDAPKSGLHEPENAVEWAIENQPASRGDIVSECYDDSIATVSADTWWRNRVRPGLEDAGMEYIRNRGWQSIATESAEKEN